jgi:phage terminase Nu1 subunit (DNA packaging protein)
MMLNQRELAVHLGTTAATVRNYERLGWIKRGSTGKYDQDACRKRVLAGLRERVADRDGNSGDLPMARAELARAQREAIEWKNAVNRGDYVSADAVVQRLQDTFAILRAVLLTWAGKLPAQLEGLSAAEKEAVLEREVYEVLEALADPDTYPEPVTSKRARRTARR